MKCVDKNGCDGDENTLRRVESGDYNSGDGTGNNLSSSYISDILSPFSAGIQVSNRH